MRRLYVTLALAAAALLPALSQRAGNPFVGRWNMTVTSASDRFPSWMEAVEQEGNLQVRVQGRTGNVNPAAAVKMDGARLIVTVTAAVPAREADENRPAAPARPELVWELTGKGGNLTGTQRQGDRQWQLTGVRAPALQRAAPASWGDPEPLFNGKDLTGWTAINNTPEAITGAFTNNWIAKDGELVNQSRGSNLRTVRTFDDFKLHAEFYCLAGCNSGIYLRGRYELQVTPPPQPARAGAPGGGPGGSGGAPSPSPRNPFLGIGSIYGQLGPSTPPASQPGWQTYDVTLAGRRVTVVFNGVTIIEKQEIPGITGGALDSNEAEPGPIYLQGDHPGSVRYRNLTISLPKP